MKLLENNFYIFQYKYYKFLHQTFDFQFIFKSSSTIMQLRNRIYLNQYLYWSGCTKDDDMYIILNKI